MTFADELRQVRERYGLSQSRLAMAAGYDHSYVSRLESDSRMPARSAVLSLADAMGCGASERDQLLVAAGYMPFRVEHLFDSEPEIGRVWASMNDAAVPDHVNQAVRFHLSMAAQIVDRWESTTMTGAVADG